MFNSLIHIFFSDFSFSWNLAKLGAPHNKRNREQRTENKNFNLSEIILWNTQFLISWNSYFLFSVPYFFYCVKLLTRPVELIEAWWKWPLTHFSKPRLYTLCFPSWSLLYAAQNFIGNLRIPSHRVSRKRCR